MDEIKILAGNINKKTIDVKGLEYMHIANIEIASEENVKKVFGTAAWGIAGAILLGPLGAIGGMLVGGNKKTVVYIIILEDGSELLVSSNTNAFTQAKAIQIKQKNNPAVVQQGSYKKYEEVKKAGEAGGGIMAISFCILGGLSLFIFKDGLSFGWISSILISLVIGFVCAGLVTLVFEEE